MNEIILESKKFDTDKLLKVLFICGLSAFGLWLLLLIIFAATKSPLVHEIYGEVLFGDFAETLSYGLVPNPYTGEYGVVSIYPPISFLIFIPFSVFCVGPIKSYIAGELTLAQLAANGGFIVSVLIFFVFNMAIVMFIAAKMTKFKGKRLAYLLTAIGCFGPFLLEFVRANNTFVVCICAMLFFYLNSAEKRWQRELSYLALAGATMMKVYPGLMIFYLLWKEKGLEKLWSILKTLGYVVVLVFVPFVFIEGGFANIPVLIQNLTGFSSGVEATAALSEDFVVYTGSGATAWPTNITLDTIIYFICRGLSYLFKVSDMSGLHGALSSLLRYSLVLLAVVLPCLNPTSKKQKEFVALAVGTYIMFPGVGNGYVLTLMVIPFLFTVLDWENMSFKNKVFDLVCYMLVFSPAMYLYRVYLISAIAALTLIVKSIVVLIADDVQYFKNKIGGKKAQREQLVEEVPAEPTAQPSAE